MGARDGQLQLLFKAKPFCDLGFILHSFADELRNILVVVLICQNPLVEFELLNQPLDLLDADIAGHDQPKAGVFRQQPSR